MRVLLPVRSCTVGSLQPMQRAHGCAYHEAGIPPSLSVVLPVLRVSSSCLVHCKQGRPVGLYTPPPELQGKAKKRSKGGEMTAPETQLVASGRLASASEADSAQRLTGLQYTFTQGM